MKIAKEDKHQMKYSYFALPRLYKGENTKLSKLPSIKIQRYHKRSEGGKIEDQLNIINFDQRNPDVALVQRMKRAKNAWQLICKNIGWSEAIGFKQDNTINSN